VHNELKMGSADQAKRKTNHMIPDLGHLSGTVHHTFSVNPALSLSGKIGLVRDRIGDSGRLSFYQELHPAAEAERWFVPFSLGVSYSKPLSEKMSAGLLAEVASAVPEPEQLYIAVEKLAPMGMVKPWRAGNPGLDSPVRGTLRARIGTAPLRLEVFGTRVWDYIHLKRMAVAGQPYLTFENVDGLLLGFHLHGDWRFAAFNAAYTWAENRTYDRPLAEIAPFLIETTLKTPRSHGFAASVRLTYANDQSRVDTELNETATPSWHRVDAKASYAWQSMELVFEVANLTNSLYYEHLSYMRDPFSSGARVYDPGRTIRLNLSFSTH
jgi:iron complex outermembrane receptor protein